MYAIFHSHSHYPLNTLRYNFFFFPFAVHAFHSFFASLIPLVTFELLPSIIRMYDYL